MALRFGDCDLRPELFELRRRGQPVAVEPKVLQLLIHLVRNRTRAVTRAELFEAIWSDVKVGNASLTRAVVEARRAIGDDAQEMIVTLRSHGFRFEAPVTESAPAEPAPTEITSTLVGREAPLAAMGAQLEQALSSPAAFAWISGVAGIGKTRLLDEIATRARARDADVHVTRCHETPTQPPFRPWLFIFDAIARRGGADAEAAHAAHAALTERGADTHAFDVVVRTLQALGGACPRFLAFDDLQWADEGTLDLLRFVAREARDARLFLVCAFRETAHADDARSGTMARLLCEYGGVHLPLRGLSEEETGQLIQASKGLDPSPRFRVAVHERTGGCPLFIQQLLATEWAENALGDEARSIATSIDMKRTLMESAARHLEGVSVASRDVLAWASVLGKSFAFTPLARITMLSADVLLDRLEEARRARLVRRADEGEYRFVHPLVADAMYEGLPASERAARHRTTALALEAHYASSLDLHAGQIARHFVRAAPTGTALQAFDYSSRAARFAFTNGDLRESAKHWIRAMRALDLLPASETARLGALLELARVYVSASETDRARHALFDAAMLAQALGRSDSFAEAALLTRRLQPASGA